MNQTTINAFAVAAGRINRDVGTISGVSVITTGTVRGHGMFADETTLAQVYGLMREMGAVKVKADHWSGFDKIVGALVNPTIDGDRVRADFQLIQSHEMYPVIMELAEKQPETFGFSIAFSGVPEEKEKQLYARASELYSVDLVDAPAANPSGLFSGGNINPIKGTQSMIEQIKELLGFAAKTDERLSALQAEVAKVTSLEAKNKELITALEAKDAEIKALGAAIEESKKAVDAAKAEAETLSARKAAEIVASQGVPPVPAGAPTDTLGSNDLEKSYQEALQKGPEAVHVWFQKNRKAISLARASKKQ